MSMSLKITFKGFPHSAAVETDIRAKAAKLEKSYPNIMQCHVLVKSGHHPTIDNRFLVRIELFIPQKIFVVRYSDHDATFHPHVCSVINDAFDAATKRLADYTCRQLE